MDAADDQFGAVFFFLRKEAMRLSPGRVPLPYSEVRTETKSKNQGTLKSLKAAKAWLPFFFSQSLSFILILFINPTLVITSAHGLRRKARW